MPLASSEEMESNDTTMTIDGDRVLILLEKVKCYNCSNFFFYV
jgi:hypothetical protein